MVRLPDPAPGADYETLRRSSSRPVCAASRFAASAMVMAGGVPGAARPQDRSQVQSRPLGDGHANPIATWPWFVALQSGQQVAVTAALSAKVLRGEPFVVYAADSDHEVVQHAIV
jgi:hypothetical protein